VVAEDAAVAVFDMDAHLALRNEAPDGVRGERASSFPDSRGVFAAKTNDERDGPCLWDRAREQRLGKRPRTRHNYISMNRVQETVYVVL
jgi:hypothetical protein